MKRFIFISLVFFYQMTLSAQSNNVGIGTTTPDASAVLDLTADDKGLLTPRMSTLDRESIANPAEGLLAFDTDTNTFWYHTGDLWIEIGRDVRSWNEKIEKQLVNNMIRPDSLVRDYNFAASVAIDGDRAFFGVLDDYNQFAQANGEAHVYFYDGNEWIPEEILVASNGGPNRGFGTAVDIDGDYAVVGSPLDGSTMASAGSVYIYKYDGASWTEQARLEPSDIAASYAFGSAVKIDGDYIAISATGAINSGNRTGAVYIFHRSGTNWIEESKIIDPSIISQEQFGISIDLVEDRLAVCHLLDTISTDQLGSVHVYERSGTMWSEVQKITYDSPQNVSYFGRSVTLSYPYLAARVAHGENGGNESLYGNVILFKHASSNYDQSYIIEEPYNINDKFSFGLHIDMDSENILLGSFKEAHLYSRFGNEWVHQMEMPIPGNKKHTQLGHPVVIEGDHIIICEPKNSEIFKDNGAAYYINKSEPLCDKDMDPTNEIETWATLAGIPEDLSDGDDRGAFENVNGVVRSAGSTQDNFVFGDSELPTNGVPVFENLLFFYGINAAFRVGRLNNSVDWSPDSLGAHSIALGNNVKAKGHNSFAIGKNSEANEKESIAMGNSTKANGDGAVSVGSFNNANGDNSIAIGSNTLANGTNSFTMGRSTRADGNDATAMGYNTDADGDYSTAMGYITEASGLNSLSTGDLTQAKGDNSVTFGRGTRSNAYAATSIGRYNVGQGTGTSWIATDPVFEVGIGLNSLNRENAISVLKNGTVAFKEYTFPNIDGTADQIMTTDGSGNITWVTPPSGADNLGNHTATLNIDMDDQRIINLDDPLADGDAATKSYVDGALVPLQSDINDNASDIVSNIININSNAANIFNNTVAINTHTTNDTDLSPTNELQTLSIAGQDLTLSSGNTVTLPSDTGAFENNSGVVRNTGSSDDDFVFGKDELPENGIAVDGHLFFFDSSKGAFRAGALNSSENWAQDSLGFGSAAFGSGTRAIGNYTLASGANSIASGLMSISMGYNSESTNCYSVALGLGTKANGFASFSVGSGTRSRADYSSTLGHGTIAESLALTAIGQFNVGGGNDTMFVITDPIFEVGIGSDINNRKNALTVLKNGRVSFKDYSFPNSEGAEHEVMLSDGSGQMSWGNTNKIQDEEGDCKIEFNSADNKIVFTTNNIVTAKIEPDSMFIDGNLKVGSGAGAKLYLGNAFLQSSSATIIKCDASLRPNTDDTFDLGSSGKRWQDVWATNGVIQTSDRRLKKNITKMRYGLPEVLALKPVTYHWNKEEDAKQQHLGLIAQNLLEVIPEVVSEAGEYLGVKYAELVPVLIAAIQDQQEIIKNQKDEINALQNQNTSTSSSIKDIMDRLIRLEGSEIKISINE